jgi:hypothetical protein
MRGSAALMALLGLAAIFMPQEIVAAAGVEPRTLPALAVQLAGAPCLGFAVLDWMAQGSVIGGIYGRPVTIANLAHYTIGGLALLKAVLAGAHSALVVAGALAYLVFAALFAAVAFGNRVAVDRRA